MKWQSPASKVSTRHTCDIKTQKVKVRLASTLPLGINLSLEFPANISDATHLLTPEKHPSEWTPVDPDRYTRIADASPRGGRRPYRPTAYYQRVRFLEVVRGSVLYLSESNCPKSGYCAAPEQSDPASAMSQAEEPRSWFGHYSFRVPGKRVWWSS